MTHSKRFRFPKAVVFAITALYLILIVATYFLYFKEPYTACAKRLMLGLFLGLIFQMALNYVNFRSSRKIVILATLFVSSVLFSGALSSFFNFRIMCRFLGY